MARPFIRLGDVARVLPWIGAGLLVYSFFALINKLNHPGPVGEPPSYLLSGRFDTVVIDPGHGGVDEGASAHGLKEKEITLEIAQRLADALRKEGIHSILTRVEDTYVGLPDRVNFANLVPHAVFISLHCDFSSNPGAKGFQVFHCNEKAGHGLISVSVPGAQDKSLDRIELELAQHLSDAASERLHLDNRGEKSGNFFVIRNVFYPSVLVECGFLTNAEEAKRLALSSYRQELAKSLAVGLVRYRRAMGNERVETAQQSAEPNRAASF